MTYRDKEIRPNLADETDSKTFPGVTPKSTDPMRLSHRAALAEVERRADLTGYVVRAVTTMTNGAVKVQHYASLHAAVRAAERAERRGCLCVLSLCRVVPVERVDLEAEAVAR